MDVSKCRESYNFRPYFMDSLYQEPDPEPSQEPRGRSGHRIAVCNTYMYLYGGYNPISVVEDVLFKEIWRFNLTTREWQKENILKSTIPDHLASMSMKMFGKNLVIHGGTGVPFGESKSDSTYVVDCTFKKRKLKKLKTRGSMPQPVYGHASVIDRQNNVMYIVGGTCGLYFTMSIYSLNLNTLEWLNVTPRSSESPDGRYRHEVALYDSKLIVFGGGTSHKCFDFQGLPFFDLTKLEWDTMWTKGFRTLRKGQREFPKPRRCHSGVLVPAEDGSDARFIISGGFNGRRAFSDVWSLNLRTKQWEKWKTTLPYELYFHDAALNSLGQMVIFGGIFHVSFPDDETATYFQRTNQVLQCWVKIPKLSEIAWEALLAVAPELYATTKRELLKIGVPSVFADRLHPTL